MDATYIRSDKVTAEIIPAPQRKRMHRLTLWQPVRDGRGIGENLIWEHDYPTADAADQAARDAEFYRLP